MKITGLGRQAQRFSMEGLMDRSW